MRWIGRFLGLLELFRERAIAFEQPEALGELKVSCTGERAPDEVNLSRGEEDYEASDADEAGIALPKQTGPKST